uniref:DnaJ homolog subfamily B member 7-like isoform X4 n=1 Tax=Rhizophora mucronata TaxID=61149 RepID=A0A2P2LBQ5_RHIMU
MPTNGPEKKTGATTCVQLKDYIFLNQCREFSALAKGSV